MEVDCIRLLYLIEIITHCFIINRTEGLPVLHLGPIASGRGVALDDQLRQEFAYKNGILAYDPELDSVVEV